MAYRPAKGMTEERRIRANESLRLRRDGWAYRDIGNHHEVSTTTAYNDVQIILKEITRENAEELLLIEMERLDDDQARLTEALDVVTKAVQGDMVDVEKWTGAVAKLIAQRLAVSDRRARLLGLDKIKPDDTKEVSGAFSEMMTTLRSRHPRPEPTPGDISDDEG